MVDNSMNAEMQSGFNDAKIDFESMLSCPQCRTERCLIDSPPGSQASDYLIGQRLLWLDVKHRKHECV